MKVKVKVQIVLVLCMHVCLYVYILIIILIINHKEDTDNNHLKDCVCRQTRWSELGLDEITRFIFDLQIPPSFFLPLCSQPSFSSFSNPSPDPPFLLFKTAFFVHPAHPIHPIIIIIIPPFLPPRLPSRRDRRPATEDPVNPTRDQKPTEEIEIIQILSPTRHGFADGAHKANDVNQYPADVCDVAAPVEAQEKVIRRRGASGVEGAGV